MTNSLAQARRLAGAAGETPMPALNRRYFGEEYFCSCFICSSESVCAHREPELIVWWLGLQRVEVPAKAPNYTLPAIAALPVVSQIPSNRPEAPKREIPHRSFSSKPEYSGLRGW